PSRASGTAVVSDSPGVPEALEGPQIKGILYLDKTLLYCIPDADKLDGLEQTLTDFLKDKQVSCLNGESTAGIILLDALDKLGRKPYQTNHYNTMTLQASPLPPPEALSCDDEIKRCASPELDTELLLQLQKMYMAKEVAPAGKQVTDLEATAQLKSILKDQLCFALWADGEIVAKANTNAIGFNYVQLGGVYTHPLYRKNYYAWHLVYTICTRVLKTGRKISLFVKEKNNPAHALYERIGFTTFGKYEIAYF
ncbi:MAG: GNAT family N-acetyltransferase, partial [Treponema sp.]|nr:GNAT family N-acetyltransferase [Treponema sp.]